MQKIDATDELNAYILPHLARVIQVAIAGRFSVSFVGPSGSGKSFLKSKLTQLYGLCSDISGADYPQILEFRYCECGNKESLRECHCFVKSVSKYVSDNTRIFRSNVILAECPNPRPSDFMEMLSGRKTYMPLFIFDDEEIFARDSVVLDRQVCLDLLKAAITEMFFDWTDFNNVVLIAKTLAMMEGRKDVEPQDVAEAVRYRCVHLIK
jgi:hypothetical protein